MELHLVLRLTASDHAQDLRAALLDLTGHDVSGRLGYTTLTLIQAVLKHWNEFPYPELLREAVTGSMGHYLSRFHLNYALCQSAIETIIVHLGRIYEDVYPFLAPIMDNITSNHHIGASIHNGARVIELKVTQARP